VERVTYVICLVIANEEEQRMVRVLQNMIVKTVIVCDYKLCVYVIQWKFKH